MMKKYLFLAITAIFCLSNTSLNAANNPPKKAAYIVSDGSLQEAVGLLENLRKTPKSKAYKTALMLVLSNDDLKRACFLIAVEDEDLKHASFFARMVKEDVSTEDEFTPLMIACEKNNEQLVKILLDAKANAHYQNKNGVTAIHCASEAGHESIVRLLLDHDATLLKTKGPQNQSLLHTATTSGKLPLVQYLVEEKLLPVDIPDKEGFTPLWNACYFGKYDVAAYLIKNGANVDRQGVDGCHPLCAAVTKSKTKIVELLLSKNAKISQQAAEDFTPLCSVAEDNVGKTSIAEMLIKHGANVKFHTPKEKLTPLHIAAKSGNSTIIPLLIKHGADINAQDAHGATPLYLAAQHGRATIVIKLIQEYKADYKICDKHGNKPLAIAHKNGHTDVVSWIMKLTSKQTKPQKSNQRKNRQQNKRTKRQIVKQPKKPKQKTRNVQNKNASTSTAGQIVKQRAKSSPKNNKNNRRHYVQINFTLDTTALHTDDQYVALRQYKDNKQGIMLILYKQHCTQDIPVTSVRLDSAYANKHPINKDHWDSFHHFSSCVDQFIANGIYIDENMQEDKKIKALMDDVNLKPLTSDRYAIVIPGKIENKWYNHQFAMDDKEHAWRGSFSGAFVYIFDRKTQLCRHRCFHENKASKTIHSNNIERWI